MGTPNAAMRGYGSSEHLERGGAISSTLLGMALFIGSEVMFFGTLFGSYFTLRAGQSSWPPLGQPRLDPWYASVLTVILVSSSVTMQFGVFAIRKNDQRKLRRWLAITIFLGFCFVLGQGYEWTKLISEHHTISTGVYFSTFYTLTGFHGAHVTGGAIFISIVLARAKNGQFTPKRHDAVEMSSYYWHFVDVVWIGLWSTLYLLQ